MFRELRRARQRLPGEEARQILRTASHGVLAVSGDDGYPYAVPLSYIYVGDRLYFHCARDGHKLDAVRRCAKASFCVVAQDDVLPERYTTCFRSVIAFGRIRVVEDERLLRRMALLLADKYCPALPQEGKTEELERGLPALCMLELRIEHLTGKEAIELTRLRGGTNV